MIQKVQGELIALSELLGLEYEQQDWGIVNADGSRLVEFIEYYEANAELSATQRFELGGLILASANEHLAGGHGSIPLAFEPFLLRRRPEFEAHVEYWRSLDDVEEFPLADWLRAHVPTAETR